MTQATKTRNARLLDPETSHEAGAAVERFGKAQAHRERCELALLRNPRITAKTVAKIAKVERHEASRRLPELREDRKAKHCPSCGEADQFVCDKHCRYAEKANGQLVWYHMTYKAKKHGQLF